MKVYIDGENFRKGLENSLRKSGALPKGEILQRYRINDLLQDVLGIEELEIVYYASRVKLPKGYEPSSALVELASSIKAESRVWLSSVVGQGIALVKAGNLKIRQSKPCRMCGAQQEILQEKGVDVRLATDLLEDIYERHLPSIGLLSSDTDLCPVVHKAVDKQVRVMYICFADGLNRAVAASASETVAIPNEKVKQYLEGDE